MHTENVKNEKNCLQKFLRIKNYAQINLFLIFNLVLWHGIDTKV